MASSIAEYLRLAMEYGAVHYWPRVHAGRRGDEIDEGIYADAFAAVERFQAPPVVPDPVRPGVRVNLRCFSAGGRGEVLELRDVQIWDGSIEKYAKVATDYGSTLWAPTSTLSPLKKREFDDAYEQLRETDWSTLRSSEKEVVAEHLERVAYAIAPCGAGLRERWIRGGAIREVYRRAAGILGQNPLSVTAETVAEWYEVFTRSGSDLEALNEEVPYDAKSKLAYDKRGLSQLTTKYADLFEGLMSGLTFLAYLDSHTQEVPGEALLDRALVDRLDAMQKLEWNGKVAKLLPPLVHALRKPKVLADPRREPGEYGERYGLTDGEVMTGIGG